MTTLVTGATGFVGSAVARRLIEAGHSVRVLVRAGSDRRNLEGLPVEIVEGDLRERATLDAAVAGCQGLFHVAADYRLWARHPEEFYENNVGGTVNMIRAAADAGVERMVYTSSVATLGSNADGTPADETTPSRPEDMIGHYKRSKYLAEAEVRRITEEEVLPLVIVNPSTPIGPRDIKPTPTGRMILDAAAGRMPAYVDTGLNVVHVDDVADGHLLAYERGRRGERYILGGENLTLQQILAEVARLCGRRPPRLKLPHGAVMPVAWLSELLARAHLIETPLATVDGVRMARKRMFFSSDKAREQLGYEPGPATGAIADAIEWFRAEGYLRGRAA